MRKKKNCKLSGREWELLDRIPKIENMEVKQVKEWAEFFGVAVDTLKKELSKMDYEIVILTGIRKVER